jgi:uncharacterized protein
MILHRLFLDANVLFSAAYMPGAFLARLWRLGDVTLIASAYAVAEARINLESEEQIARLDQLLARVEIVAVLGPAELSASIKLPAKDLPILQAAVSAHATHLITGDLKHFGKYFGRTVAGVLIMRPADYLRSRQNIPPKKG